MAETKTFDEVIVEINELADKNLGLKEAIFIKHYVKEKKYNLVRAYMESCVLSVQNKLLDSIVESEYDPVYGSRYKTVKKIDNLITYLCENI